MISIGKFAFVFAPCDEFDSRSDLLGESFGGAASSVGDHPFGKPFGNDVFNFLADEFIAAVAELFFCLDVQQDDPAALVHDHHRIWRGFEQPTIAAFHLREMFISGFAHADIANGGGDQDAFGAFERTQHDFNWEFGFILSAGDEFDSRSDLLSESVGGAARAVGDIVRQNLRG